MVTGANTFVRDEKKYEVLNCFSTKASNWGIEMYPTNFDCHPISNQNIKKDDSFYIQEPSLENCLHHSNKTIEDPRPMLFALHLLGYAHLASCKRLKRSFVQYHQINII